MSVEQKPQVWPWIVAFLIGLPLLYVASFGPACWIDSRSDARHSKLLSAFYRPILYCLFDHGDSGSFKKSMMWYARIGIPHGKYVRFHTSKSLAAVPGFPSRSTR